MSWKSTGHRALFLELDLASHSSVKAAAELLQAPEIKLDILINNAGVMNSPKATTTDGANSRTLSLLLSLPEDTDSAKAKLSQWRFIRVSLPRVIGGPACRKMSPFDLYNQSKFADVVIAFEFARRYGLGKGKVVSMAVHPGLIASSQYNSPTVMKLLSYLTCTPAEGALTSLYAATSPETANANGKYLMAWTRIGKPHPKTTARFDRGTGLICQ
ncbi:hypothetical protein C8R47DRAFT_1224228 [Mycena vitilis]|nr:hypothetical protein C8R47DRAFT_1224228 [Mycena vitilis]